MHKKLTKQQQSESSVCLNNQSCTIESRINLIEQNLSRICLQQDALLPLLQVLEMIPQLTKTDNNLKLIQKRIEEQENKTQKNEKLIEKALKDVTNQNTQSTKSLVDLKQNNKFDILQKQLKDMENSFNNIYKSQETKIKEDNHQIQKSFDKKIENNKKEIQDQKKDSYKNDLQKLKEEIQQYIEKELIIKFDEKINCGFDDLKQNIECEIRNIYKEIGGQRCEIDFIFYEQRQKNIEKKFPDLQAIKQDKILYSYLDYEFFLTDLEQFDLYNSEKLLYEIDLLKKECEYNLKIKAKDFDFLMERKVNLQYQIQGRKKKIAIDLKIIENKNDFFLQIDQLSQEDQEQIKNLDLRVENLIEIIYNNIDNCDKEVLEIGELINQKKMQSNQQDEDNYE